MKKENNFTISAASEDTLKDAHGTIVYGMANDYMFRAVLQTNEKVLRGMSRILRYLQNAECKKP